MEPKDGKRLQQNNIQKPSEAAGVEITFYTDPLCCWTWAMQPQWKRLLADLQDRNLLVRYKMAGLLPSWATFNDNVNSIRKPVQMGPEWMHARAISGAVIDDRIWITDPPASSFPACIAVKCAELQSSAMGAQLLNLIQEAVMVKNLNIAKTSVLEDIATALSMMNTDFDLRRFQEDLLGEEAKEAFRKDLQECRYLKITRLPTILFKSAHAKSGLLTGYQSYESLISGLTKHMAISR
jgi:putative protein-disulfide isomerase